MTVLIPKRPKSGAEVPMGYRLLNSPPFKKFAEFVGSVQSAQTIPSDNTEVVKTASLNAEILEDFFENRICAIHIPDFCPPEVCEIVSHKAVARELTNWNIVDPEAGYRNSDVDTIGLPFRPASRTDREWQEYFTSALATATDIRELASPYPSPLDRFRVMMDERWQHGMMLRRYKGLQMQPGLIRVMSDNTGCEHHAPLNCHFDTSPLLNNHRGVFSVNIYLKKPADGGDLYLWNPDFRVMKHFPILYNFLHVSSYMNEQVQRDFQDLLPPPHVVKIGQGDLVMINTGRPHAVAPMQGGPRVSLQAFLRYRKDRPLEIWA